MNKAKKQTVLLIISVVLAIIMLAGMILATVLLSRSDRKEWTYYTENNRTDYYADDLTFSYTSDFSSALQSYLGKTLMQYLGISGNISQFSNRVIYAMQQANVPAIRLKTIADVINNNRINDVFGNIVLPFSDVDGLTAWSDEFALSLTDETFFSIIGSIIDKFFDITTLTEEEFATFLYCYLDTYAQESYRLVLKLYGKDNIISLFSDTLFAVRMLSGSSDRMGKTMGMNALRTSLYQLGRFYLDISKLGDNFTFEKIFGLPDQFNTENKPEIAEEINEEYSLIRGSFGRLFTFFGNLMTVFETEDLIAYSEYARIKKENHARYSVLTEKKETGLITSEEETELNRIVDKQNRYRIYAAQRMLKAVIRAADEYSDNDENKMVAYIKEKMLSMRYLLYILSEPSESTYENYVTYTTMINDDSEKLIAALEYYSDKDYTLDQIMEMNDISEQTDYAEGFDAGSEMMELYFSSVFNIWLKNKVNDWGLIKNE